MSFVGVLPDNIEVPSVPGSMPKFSILVRTEYPVDQETVPAMITLSDPNGGTVAATSITIEQANEAVKAAAAQGNTHGGINTRIMASPFVVNATGRWWVKVQFQDGEEIPAGTINIQLAGWVNSRQS